MCAFHGTVSLVDGVKLDERVIALNLHPHEFTKFFKEPLQISLSCSADIKVYNKQRGRRDSLFPPNLLTLRYTIKVLLGPLHA